ncbi:MAG TPA: TonB-dependent receptor [Parafilimonas sp.]|nr:TonB-dependent receptor [Parafilimonas sp.]
MKHYILGSLFLIFFSLQLSAQFKISGTISDSISKDKLVDATVTLHNNIHNLNTTANSNGEFVFNNVISGNYILDIDLVGYQRFSQRITVTAKDISLHILLSRNQSTLAAVNVFTTINGEQESGSRLREKNANNIVNVISAQAMQRSPDINAANVLQRMSGITLQKNSGADEAYAIVRGLEPRYNNTLINGVKITSPDEKSRFVSLDIVPSELLQKIEISKSLLPEMEGDAIGGTVNLVMKDAPDSMILHATASLGYSSIFFTRQYSYFSTKDIQQKSLTERLGNSYVAQPNDFSRSNLDFKEKTALPTGTAGITYGKRFLNNKLGVLVADNFQNQYFGTNSLLNQAVPDVHLAIPAISDVSDRTFSTQQLNDGLSLHADYNINKRNKIILNNLLLYSALQQSRLSIDTAILGGNGGRTVPGTGPVTTDYTSITSHELLENLKLEGRHILSKHLAVDWAGVYSLAYKRSPDRADLGLNKKIDTVHTTADKNGPYTFSVTPDYFDNITRIWQHNKDQDINGLANVTYKTTLKKFFVDIQAGGLYRHKTRYNLQDEYDLKPTTNTNGVKQVFTNINTAQWVVYNPAGTYTYDVNNYHAYEDISAGYGEVKLSSNKFDVFGGVRVEHTKQGFTINNFHPGSINGVNKNYTDVLPSIQLKYNLNSRMDIRGSYFKSISRPNYYELVPYNILNNSSANNEEGNPYLNHSVADNYDLRYEFFPGDEEQLFVGGFYKRIQNPIEYAYINGTTYQPVNLGTATVYGSEAVFTKYFGNVGITGNYTYIYSKIYSIKSYTDLQAQTTYDKLQKRPMQGETNNTVNVSLLYKNDKKKIFAQLAYQYLGRTLAEVYPIYGFDYYQKPQSFLSFSAEYNLSRRFTLFGKFNNILNTPTYYNINNLVVGKDVFYSNFQVGFRYSN